VRFPHGSDCIREALKIQNSDSMKKLLFISSLVLLIAGFGAKSQSTYVSANKVSEVTQPSNKSTSTSANLSLELFDPGAEPRQELRFTPAVNAKQTVAMTVDMDITMSINGQSPPQIDTPAVEIKIETQVTKVDANGDIYTDFSYSDVDVIPAPNTPPELVNTMRSQLQSLVGLQGSIIIDVQGNTKDINFDLPENLDPISEQMFEQMSNSLKQLSSPFPSEAIGVGAKWQVPNSVSINNGISINQIATYELVSLQDNIATLEVSLEQNAPPQSINLPGMPPGASVELESLDSEGQGDMTIGLSQIMPISATISLDSNTKMKVTPPNSAQEMTMDMNLLMNMNLESQ